MLNDIKNETGQKALKLAVFTSMILLLCVSFFNSLSFPYYYIYGHIDEVGIGIIIFGWIKLSALLVLPLAVFMNVRSAKNIAKYLYFPIALLSLLFVNKYAGLSKVVITDEEKIFFLINDIISQSSYAFLYISESVLIAATSLLLGILNGYKISDLKSFIWLPLALLAVTPLNIFDNAVRLLSNGVYSFFKFKNFSVWHFLSLFILATMSIAAYFVLKKRSPRFVRVSMCALAITMLIQYISKNSMIVGDGYNVYYTLINALPLFICNIGVFIVALSIFSKKKFLYALGFFIHAGGALSVFVYFGRDELSNFGTIFNYSFLYFTLTHALLFLLCIMPTCLSLYKFSLKNCIAPLVCFFCFIIFSSLTSAAISNIEFSAPGVNTLIQINPNFAFTQVNPLPIPLPPVFITVFGGLRIDILYNFILYLVYVSIFFAFYGCYRIFILLNRLYHNIPKGIGWL